jgi:hypothetical protein
MWALKSECAAASEERLPDAASVIERLKNRAEEVGQADEAKKYSYEKHTHHEELDPNGIVTKKTDKMYNVYPIGGIPFSRLIKIQDRDLTDEEVAQQNRKEEEFRRKVNNGTAKPKEEEDVLNAGLLEHYDFRVERRDRANDRPTLVLSFQPKHVHQAEKSVEDKVLNRLAGRLWVDEKEAEVVRVEVGLTEDLSLGLFGMVGSLKRCDLKIERQRLPDGIWVDQAQQIELAGRRLFSNLHFRGQEEYFNFKRP